MLFSIPNLTLSPQNEVSDDSEFDETPPELSNESKATQEASDGETFMSH